MPAIPLHRSKGLLPFSFDFVKNSAQFTATTGLTMGDFYKLNLPFHNIHVITDPNLIREVIVRKEGFYEKSKIYWKQLRTIIGPALGSLEGEEWKFLRQLHSPHFTQNASQAQLPLSQSILQKKLARLERGEIELVEYLAGLNTELLLAVVFGIQANGQANEIAKSIADGELSIAWRSKYPWRPFLANFTGANQRIKNHLQFFDEFTEKAIADLRQLPTTKKTLFHTIVENLQGEGALGRSEFQRIRNEFIVYLGAGTETMAISECYALYLLWKHPHILQKVKDELKQVCADKPVQVEHLPKLKFLEAVVLESMRLQPSSYALLRDCVEPHEINGYPMEKGDSVFISIYALHRNPRLWDKPLNFDPSRFLQAQPIKQSEYRYLPYGAGKHICIGRYLATPQMVLTLAAIIQRFNFEFLMSGELEVESVSTLKPKGGFKVILEPTS